MGAVLRAPVWSHMWSGIAPERACTIWVVMSRGPRHAGDLNFGNLNANNGVKAGIASAHSGATNGEVQQNNGGSGAEGSSQVGVRVDIRKECTSGIETPTL
jgi:hypothetical protein